MALRQGQRGARAAFLAQHAEHVDDLVRWIVGPDSDLAAIRSRVFVRALLSVRRRSPCSPDQIALWLERLAVEEARRALRWRRARRWWRRARARTAAWVKRPIRATRGTVSHHSSVTRRGWREERASDVCPVDAALTNGDALSEAYAVVHSLPARHATALCLYWAGGYETSRVAQLCAASYADAAKWIDEGQSAFLARARRNENAWRR
jgi:DNA-directed RNA polymerase specialized sigma24 family protein